MLASSNNPDIQIWYCFIRDFESLRYYHMNLMWSGNTFQPINNRCCNIHYIFRSLIELKCYHMSLQRSINTYRPRYKQRCKFSMLQIPRDVDLKCFSTYFMSVFVAPALVASVANFRYYHMNPEWSGNNFQQFNSRCWHHRIIQISRFDDVKCSCIYILCVLILS